LIDQELEVYEAVQQSCTFPEYITKGPTKVPWQRRKGYHLR